MAKTRSIMSGYRQPAQKSGEPVWHIGAIAPEIQVGHDGGGGQYSGFSGFNGYSARRLDDGVEHTATEALAMMGNPEISLHKLSFRPPSAWDADTSRIDAEAYSVIRHPFAKTKGWDDYRQLGIVTTSYEHVSPASAVELWDKNVGLPVDRIAFTTKGAKMLIAGKLPSITVGDETIDHYLLLFNPMNGGGSIAGYVTGIRPFCTNVLPAVVKSATASFRVPHNAGAMKRIGDWLKAQSERYVEALKVIEENYNRMTEIEIPTEQVMNIAESVYPDPLAPKKNKGYADWEKTLANYELAKKWRTDARDKVVNFFDESGTGFDTVATSTPNLWRAYQSFTEFETWRAGTASSIAVNSIDGDRAVNMRKAYSGLMDYANLVTA